MSLELFVPHAGDHAIQNVAFGVEWEGVLPPEAFAGIEQALRASQIKDLGEKKEINSVKVEFGPEGSRAAQELGGYVFEWRAGSVVTRTFHVGQNQLIVANHSYTRWDQVWADAKRFLAVALPVLERFKKITSLGLQYVDVFVWKGNPDQFPTQEIFRRECSVLPRSTLNNTDLWHVHQGAFSHKDSPVPCKQLDAFNVDVLDAEGFRRLQIVSAHRSIFKAAQSPTYLAENDAANSLAVMTALHAANKKFLSELLSDKVCNSIKLKESS